MLAAARARFAVARTREADGVALHVLRRRHAH
jgi:hypothetical protein